MRDPYVVFGVSRSAGADEIKAAYRRLARECHPDADPGNPWAEQEFKELAQAYALLSDPAARARFDRGEIDADGMGRRGRRPRPGGPSGGKSSNRGRTVKIKGANVSYEVTVGLLDAARGVTRTLDTTSGKTLSVRIPPGTTDGQVLRLRGKGLARNGGEGDGDDRGDQYVSLRVVLPPKPDPELTRFAEQWSAAHPYSVRRPPK